MRKRATAESVRWRHQWTRREASRRKRWTEQMQARFEEGTFARIANVLYENQDRTDFVREAV